MTTIADDGPGVCRLVELKAQNFLRLQAAEIRPDGKVVEITGKNGHGKTSVLRAFWAALEGKAAVGGGIAIRRGAEEGEIHLDLDAVKITRTIARNDKTGEEEWSIRLVTKDGRRVTNRPQAMLDAIAGDGLNLDPLAFARWGAKEQADALKRLVPGFDFAKNERERAALFAERTDVNRDAKRERAAAEAVRLPDGPEPNVIEVKDLLSQLEAANKTNADIAFEIDRRIRFAASIDSKREEAEQLRTRAAILDDEADVIEREHRSAPPVREPVDVSAIRAQIAGADQARAAKALFAERRARVLAAEKHEDRAEELSTKIVMLDEAKVKAIAAAKLPVEGLALADEVVTLNGLPLAQAAMSERIKVGMAVAMATAKLPVVLIDEGSELDSASMAQVAAMVEGTSFCVLICRVDETGERGWVVEDGRVRAAARGAKK